MSNGKSADDKLQRHEQLAIRAYTTLCDEWLDAAAQDPMREIPTPAHHHSKEQLIYIVLDEFSGPDGEELLTDIIKALHECESGKAILDRMARSHARYHCAERLVALFEADARG